MNTKESNEELISTSSGQRSRVVPNAGGTYMNPFFHVNLMQKLIL
jgi:hypothetical protein